jgi:hypothetical protein
MPSKLRKLRFEISEGKANNKDDLRFILKNCINISGETSWEVFFILSAKNNKQSNKIIIESFKIAWNANQSNTERWKLIEKIASLNLLLVEDIFYEFINSQDHKEWEVFLGNIHNLDLFEEFIDIWGNLDEKNKKKIEKQFEDQDWGYVKNLFISTLEKQNFKTKVSLQNSQTHSETKKQTITKITKSTKNFLNTNIDEILERILSGLPIINFGIEDFEDLNSEEKDYFIQLLDDKLTKLFGEKNEHWIFHFANNQNNLRDLLALKRYLKFDTKIKDRNGNNIIEILINNDYSYYSLKEFIKFLYSLNHSISKDESEVILNKLKESKKFEQQIKLGYVYFCSLLNKSNSIERFDTVEREAFTVLSLKLRKIIWFKFPSFIQLANNALEHYKPFGHVFISAIKEYGFFDKLISKESFNRKYNKLEKHFTLFDYSHNDIFSTLFPEIKL